MGANAVSPAALPARRLYLLSALALLLCAGGCQTSAPVTNRRLIEHQAMIDFSGLKDAEPLGAIKASCAVPRQWEALPLKKTGLYAHQQWKSPSTHTGIGVVYVRLPLPLEAHWVSLSDLLIQGSTVELVITANQKDDRFGHAPYGQVRLTAQLAPQAAP